MSGYIGNIPVPQATQTRQSFTATASQTTFNTAGYSVGYVDVFLNGVKLAPADYTATNGSDIVLAVGAASGDILEIVAYEIFQVVDQDFTGDFTVDGSTFVVDSTNNNVGIGTQNPQAKLDVTGSVAGEHGVFIYNSNASGYAGLRMGGTDRGTNGDHLIYGSGALGLRSKTNAAITFEPSGSERMRIDSSGNVGIGVSSPVTRLDVSGGSIVVSDGNGYALFAPKPSTSVFGTDWDRFEIRVDPSSQVTYLGNTNGGTGLARDLALLAGSGERMRITSSGSVGIGTGSPSHTLELGALDTFAVQTGSTVFDLTPTAGAQDYAIWDTSNAGSGFAWNTNGTERMRIDASGNLLVGKTASTTNSVGSELRSDGAAVFVRSGSVPVVANRKTDDGDIMQFRKDNTTVGSIGSIAGAYLNIGSTGGAGAHIGLWNGSVRPTTSAGGNLDNTLDLGDTGARWRDVYVGGGVYLGGTGAANKLDDYEVGTWSPEIRASSLNPTVTYATRLGAYVIIGNTVYISFYIYCSAGNVTGGSGSIQIGNLPVAIQPNGGYSNYGLPFIQAGYVHTGGATQTGYAGNSMRWQANSNPATLLDLYSSNSTSHGTGAWELSGSGTFPLA